MATRKQRAKARQQYEKPLIDLIAAVDYMFSKGVGEEDEITDANGVVCGYHYSKEFTPLRQALVAAKGAVKYQDYLQKVGHTNG